MAGSLSNVVELDHATRRFGQVVAVEDLSLTLPAGEILGLFGPSGSGKTTTIRMILGVYQPTSGKVRILGTSSHHLGGRQRRQIGYGPQQFIYPPTLSAEEVVWFAAGLYGVGWLRTRRAVRWVLQRVDLWDKRDRRVDAMSGGERRRVANAAALVHQPRLIFMDEPTSGLDPILRERTWDWFRELRQEGRTLLVTGHYLAEAELCDRIALIVEGRLAALGTPRELRQQALGGDLVEVVVGGSLAAAMDTLKQDNLVRNVQVLGTGRVLVTVPEAGPAVPIILERLRSRGVAVHSANEFRPPFDEVYERLVEHDVPA
jgi:ABC-2 type transport system ATP-binding protein